MPYLLFTIICATPSVLDTSYIFLKNCATSTGFQYESQFSQEFSMNEWFFKRVAFLWRNLQFQSVFIYELHFSSENMQLGPVYANYTFSQEMCNSTNFQYKLYFSHDMCNSKQLSIRVTPFSRNVQPQPIIDTSYTFLKICASPTDFDMGCTFSQEMCKLNRFSIRVALFLKNM